jgi:uncharacterized membrane protein YkgB
MSSLSIKLSVMCNLAQPHNSASRKDAIMSATALQETFGKEQLSLRTRPRHVAWADRLEAIGGHTLRYGLVLVLFWIGGMKFTAYEAEGISIFVSNSPLMRSAYSVFGVRSFSALLGVTEIVVALLIAARPLSARASFLGSALAVGMFATTLSFLFTTPGVWEASAGGFPALSVVPGQFLVKDFVLLGASLRVFADDWPAVTTGTSQ